MSVPFVMPPLVVDTREQLPLVFPSAIAVERGTLATGDYSVRGYEGEFTVERKSLADLVHSVIHDRARFERELERMRPFAFRRLLVVAPFARVLAGDRFGGGYRFSAANPLAVVASVSAFEVRYGVPVAFAANPVEAARRIVLWARYFVRERVKTARLAVGSAGRDEGETGATGPNQASVGATVAAVSGAGADSSPVGGSAAAGSSVGAGGRA